jgi:hypothetical protein
VRHWLRAGELVGVRRGAYVLPGGTPDRPEARHLMRLMAAGPELADGAVVSHVSAAVVHGLVVWAVPLDRVHVTRARRAGARVTPTLHVHAAVLHPDEVVDVGWAEVTSVARTVVDLARSLPFEQAVAIADDALHRRLTTAAELAEVVARSRRRPGSPAARRVVGFADARSESVGESRSRVALHRAGLPPAELQWNAWSRRGDHLGRVDFWWDRFRTVGEFDGQVKYGRLLRPDQEPGEVVFAEKLREDALRDEGLQVVRWTWRELDQFATVAERIRRAFERG